MFCCLSKNVEDDVVQNASESGKNETLEETEKNSFVFFEGCTYRFDLEDLLRAFAEVLGKGSIGATYKVVLDEVTIFTMKRLNTNSVGKKEFVQQMNMIAKVGQHHNIVPLRAYYYSNNEKLLVYEYMEAGSLASILHGTKDMRRRTLDWDTRMKVLLGVAKGIAHIHSNRLIHGNIKSSNILLTKNQDGLISEFGLTTLINDKNLGKVGYLAPEVIKTSKMNRKSDVYSFGVVILEILTGKSPNQEDVPPVNLPKWVNSVVQEEWSVEVFDVELVNYGNVGEEMVEMLQIALACVTKLPDNRPKIDEVVRMIEESVHFRGHPV